MKKACLIGMLAMLTLGSVFADELDVQGDLVVDNDATVGGTMAVTGTVSGATPTATTHLTTKDYVDTALATKSDTTHDHDATYVNEGQSGSVTSTMIVDGTVSSADIANGTITSSDLSDGATLAEILDNDGSGSSLDADYLDGHNTSYFATASHNHDSDYVDVSGDTMSGNLTVSRSNADASLTINTTTEGYDPYLLLNSYGFNDWTIISTYPGGILRFKRNSTDWLTVDSQGTLAPSTEKQQDLGYTFAPFDDVYADDFRNYGCLDFSVYDTLDFMRNYKPAPKTEGSFHEYKTEFDYSNLYAKELDPGSLPIEVTGYYDLLYEYELNTDTDYVLENIVPTLTSDESTSTDLEIAHAHIADYQSRHSHPDNVSSAEWGISLSQGFSWNYKAICELVDLTDKLEARIKTWNKAMPMSPERLRSLRHSGSLVLRIRFRQ